MTTHTDRSAPAARPYRRLGPIPWQWTVDRADDAAAPTSAEQPPASDDDRA